VTKFGPAEARSAMKAMWADQDHYACMYPELQMRVWASPQGMRLAAVLWLPGPKFGRSSKVLAQATWAPADVTEAKVVDWGRRALAAWLDEQLAHLGDEPVSE
jgi:hypothetical protein